MSRLWHTAGFHVCFRGACPTAQRRTCGRPERTPSSGGPTEPLGSNKEDLVMRMIHLVTACGLALAAATGAKAQEIDWKKVDDAIGRGAAVTGDAHRYNFPRTDLNVTLDGVTIKPALALGGWAAFKPMHGQVMVMGDLVLLQTEVNPVMAKLLDGCIDVTACHNP